MKKAIQFLSIVGISLLLITTAWAQNTPTIIFDTENIIDGGSLGFGIPVTIISETPVFSIDFTMDYDPTLLNVSSVVLSDYGTSAGYEPVVFNVIGGDFVVATTFSLTGVNETDGLNNWSIIYFDAAAPQEVNADALGIILAYINEQPANVNIINTDGNTNLNCPTCGFELDQVGVSCDEENGILTLSFIINDPTGVNYDITVATPGGVGSPQTVPDIVAGTVFDVILTNLTAPTILSFTITDPDGNVFDGEIFTISCKPSCIMLAGTIVVENERRLMEGAATACTVERLTVTTKNSFASVQFNTTEASSLLCDTIGINVVITDTNGNIKQVLDSLAIETSLSFDEYPTGIYELRQYAVCLDQAYCPPTPDPKTFTPGASMNIYNVVEPDDCQSCFAFSDCSAFKHLRITRQRSTTTCDNDGFLTITDSLTTGIWDDEGFLNDISFSWSSQPDFDGYELSNLDFGDYTLTVTYTASPTGGLQESILNFNLTPGETVVARALLQGTYLATTGNMETLLLNDGLIPNEQPFNQTPWLYNGNEATAFFPPETVDWVLLELRSATNNDIVVESRTGLLLSDGTIIDPCSKTEGVQFYEVEAGQSYFLSIKTRNHLAVLSQDDRIIPNSNYFDFTQVSQVDGGITQLFDLGVGGPYALFTGDANSDGVITVADFNIYISQSSSINIYVDGDFDLDGNVTVSDFNLYQANGSKIGVPQIRY